MDGSAALARAFFEDTWAVASSIDGADPVLVTTEPEAPEWRSAGVRETWPQKGGDLGARLTHALAHALESGATKALAIGTDSPGLSPELVAAALDALDDADAVLGPCSDGGFYLLGLRRCPIDLLADLPWSSAETFDRTRERLRERGFRVELLPIGFDIDRPEDLEPLRQRLWRSELAAPATARALAGLFPGSPRVSVIVPVLDEEERITKALGALTAGGAWHEVIVVDGGSSDRTAVLAREVDGVRLIESPRGRARQMNRGAEAATGDVLLFLHADVELPRDALRFVARALDDSGAVAGAFRTWTVPDNRQTWLAPLLHLGDLRSRYSGLPYGDQALFVRAAVFHRIGGFPDQPLMEDLELSRRLRRVGTIRIAPARVRVSGRRFLARPLYYFLLVNLLPLLYALRIPPTRLARLYGNPR